MTFTEREFSLGICELSPTSNDGRDFRSDSADLLELSVASAEYCRRGSEVLEEAPDADGADFWESVKSEEGREVVGHMGEVARGRLPMFELLRERAMLAVREVFEAKVLVNL